MYMYVWVCMYRYICIFLKKGRERGGQLCLNTSSRVDRDTRRPFSLAKQRMLHVILIAD